MPGAQRVASRWVGVSTSVAAWFAWTASASPARAEGARDALIEVLANASVWLTKHANGILTSAYDTAPVLVTVLAAMLILPVTALSLLLVQSMRMRSGRRVAKATQPSPRSASSFAPAGFLLAPDGTTVSVPATGATISIGRHEASDLRLPIAAVHRHHAAVHCLADGTVSIADLSGTNGNGVRVNGESVRLARLRNGDLIQIGGATLTFVVALTQSVPSFVTPQNMVSHNRPARGAHV